MALKPCLECKKEVSTGAKACPNCGKQAPHKKKRSLLGWMIFLFVLPLIIGPLAYNSSTQEVEAPPMLDLGFISSRDAKDLCQKQVTSMAKYPSSVETIFMGREAYQKPDGNVLATIDFSAQNSLGGRIPHRGICTINKNGKVKVRITRR